MKFEITKIDSTATRGDCGFAVWDGKRCLGVMDIDDSLPKKKREEIRDLLVEKLEKEDD